MRWTPRAPSIITYKVTNAVRWFDDHDELYWNVTGNDWPVPIDSAAGVIVFPANAAGNLRAQAFTGAYGSVEQDATAEVRGNTVLVAGQQSALHARRADRRRVHQQRRADAAQQAAPRRCGSCAAIPSCCCRCGPSS